MRERKEIVMKFKLTISASRIKQNQCLILYFLSIVTIANSYIPISYYQKNKVISFVKKRESKLKFSQDYYSSPMRVAKDNDSFELKIVSWTKIKTSQNAKKRKQRSLQSDNDFNRWYEEVSQDSTPDDVFWDEMERQTLINKVGSNSGSSSNSLIDDEVAPKKILDPMSMESILSQFSYAMCDDNYLDDVDFYDDSDDDYSFEQQQRDLEEQLNGLEQEIAEEEEELPWYQVGYDDGDEPWDHFQSDTEKTNPEKEHFDFIENDYDLVDDDILQIDVNKGMEYQLSNQLGDNEDNNDEVEEEEVDETSKQNYQDEQEYLSSIASIQLKSPRLERARTNPKARQYFQSKTPNKNEGFDRLWISAIDEPCCPNLQGVFRNYGIEFADNFADWIDSDADVKRTIEEMASFKARCVFNITNLPCIASRTSFEIEPVRNAAATASTSTANSNMPPSLSLSSRENAAARMAGMNPRILSGYTFNNVGIHIDQLVEVLLPSSDPSRITRFRSCLCFYDGEMEIFDYGECDVDLFYCNSLRTYIPMSSAINELCKTLVLAYGLEYQKWLKSKMHKVFGANNIGSASLKLRDRVLKEGHVLPNDIIDVSSFMDSFIDVDLMDDCGDELAKHFIKYKPTKLLTVATTGLVIAIPMAKYLQVPVVYARKQRTIVMADTYKASYSSKTIGTNRELLVSKAHIEKDDRILIVDDFLSSGSSQEALLRIASEAGATVVGIAVLLEKVYDSGRQSLSGFNVPVESMVKVISVKDGIIQLVEEDGFDGLAW